MKNYRIVRLAGLHYDGPKEVLQASLTPDLSYDDMQRRVFAQAFLYSDSFSRAMRQRGHEAHELMYDLAPVQAAWRREHEVEARTGNLDHDTILAQLTHLKPDVVYFQDIYALPYAIRRRLKQLVPSIKLIVVFKGYPGAFNELDDVDILLAGVPAIARQFAAAGLKPHVLYHAFDEAIGEQVGNFETNTYDFTFLGSSGYGYGLEHVPRYEALKTLLKRTKLEAWVDEIHIGDPIMWLRIWKHNLLATMKGDPVRMPAQPLKKLFPERIHPPLFGLEMFRLLGQSKITFNKHARGAGDSVGNIRLFQATGMGACLLTDTGTNMCDLFEPDREVVTYDSIDDCIEKVSYLLEHDTERQRIAAAGRARTLKDHTISHRVAEVDELIQRQL